MPSDVPSDTPRIHSVDSDLKTLMDHIKWNHKQGLTRCPICFAMFEHRTPCAFAAMLAQVGLTDD
jgi:hypothetical protein